MQPKEAAGLCALLALAMSKTTESNSLECLARGLSGVLDRKHASRLVRQAQAVGAALGVTPLPAARLAVPALLQPTLQPLPPLLSAQTLIDLLKHPLFVGEARRLVLHELARRYGHRFADQWDFVRFAEKRKLGLDFTTPPQRPRFPEGRRVPVAQRGAGR
jgi:hypothetical protein